MRISFSRLLRFSLIGLELFALSIWAPLYGQVRVQVARADGLRTPLRVYRASGAGTGCAPLAVISPGAGGSENGYRYLAEFMARMGYATVVMGHAESGGSALRKDMFDYGLKQGVRKLVADRQAEQARLLDVGAALQWAEKQCAPPYRVLLGHSMGSETVMLEAGAGNMIGVPSPPAGQDRFDAYVALSPEGPGIVFPEHAWEKIHKPLLVLTGTRDQSLQGGPQARQIPWHDLPGSGTARCQWMGVIRGATHMNFAGIGFGARPVEAKVTGTIAAFLRGARQGRCTPPPVKAGMTLQVK